MSAGCGCCDHKANCRLSTLQSVLLMHLRVRIYKFFLVALSWKFLTHGLPYKITFPLKFSCIPWGTFLMFCFFGGLVRISKSFQDPALPPRIAVTVVHVQLLQIEYTYTCRFCALGRGLPSKVQVCPCLLEVLVQES